MNENVRFKRASKIEMIRLSKIIKPSFKKRIKLQKNIINTSHKLTKNSILSKREKGQKRNKRLISFAKSYFRSTRNSNKEKGLISSPK